MAVGLATDGGVGLSVGVGVGAGLGVAAGVRVGVAVGLDVGAGVGVGTGIGVGSRVVGVRSGGIVRFGVGEGEGAGVGAGAGSGTEDPAHELYATTMRRTTARQNHHCFICPPQADSS